MRRSFRVLSTAAVLLSVLAPFARAEDVPPAKETWQLSRAEALRTALENNLSLLIVRKDPKIAAFNVDFEEGAFDPGITAGTNYRKTKNELSSAFSTTDSETWDASAAWAQRLKFGADYSIGFGTGRSDASGPFILAPSSWGSNVALSYNMHLLRGFGTEVNTEFLVLAKNSLEISNETLRAQAHAILKATEDAYWDLLAVRAAVSVSHQTLQLAQDLYDLNKKKVDVGTLAPIEITQAEAGVASREEGVIVAETAQENAEDVLRRLMAIPDSDPAWSKQILPTDKPVSEPTPIDLESSIATALEKRPEITGAEYDLKSKELSERAAKNLTRPGLDFVANVTPAGNNFTADPGFDGIFGTIDDTTVTTDGFGESVSEIPDLNNYSWNVGLVFSLPIGNHQAKANYAISTLNREKSELALEDLEQAIRVDVRVAARLVESGAKRIAAAHANTVLQKKTVEAEQKKLENGMSTSFEVLRIQSDLADAQLAEIRAVLDYNKALSDLERAKGTLLESRGLTLEEPEKK